MPTESIYIRADIADEQQDLDLVAAVIERLGQLDILVNNAGWTARIPHDDLDALPNDILRRTMEVNVYGTWWMTQAAMPHLRASDAGNVVNVTSIAGLRPVGSSTAYGMAKAALNMLTVDLAKHCGPVRVNAVAPGLVATPWSAEWRDMHATIAETTPARRSATPEDIADAVMSCATNTYMTGSVVVVDGGLTLMI